MECGSEWRTNPTKEPHENKHVLAERGGFEPPIGFTLYTLSRRAT